MDRLPKHIAQELTDAAIGEILPEQSVLLKARTQEMVEEFNGAQQMATRSDQIHPKQVFGERSSWLVGQHKGDLPKPK